jgi:hypothetical protein
MVVAGLTILLFAGGPEGHWPRSLSHFWDLGHMGLFGAATLLALRAGLARWPLTRQAGVVLGGSLILGAVSEWLQRGSNRTASLGDLQRDLIGASLVLVFVSPAVARLPRRQRGAILAVVLLAFGWQVAPALLATVDEFTARRDFPVLAGFERPFEVDRWQGQAKFRIVDTPVRGGHRSLRVDLDTNTYSWVSLADFPRDWTAYRLLEFSVFNPDTEALELVCKVNDREHQRRGYPTADRFNRRLTAAPGWNDFSIHLEEIRKAPVGREMDLAQISTFQLFTVRLPRPRSFYLDQVELR